MYVETPAHDEEHVALVEGSRSMRLRRFVAPLCAFSLAALALAGRVAWSSNGSTFGVVQSVGLDLVDTEVQIDMDITGINFASLTPAGWEGAVAPHKAKCDLDATLASYAGAAPHAITDDQPDVFKWVVRDAVAKKTHIDVASVSIEETPISGTHPDRTQFSVNIVVPSGLDTSAVMDRLNDGATLLRDIKDGMMGCNIKRNGGVNVHSVMKTKKGERIVMETESNPSIVLEMEVKGLYYKQLILSADMKKSFVDAIQSGIVPAGLTLDPKSIALDITNGGKDAAGIPFVHVQANFPVPAGLTADATMSKWPGGRAKIQKSVEDKLKLIPNIVQARRAVGTTEAHDIVVFPGMLHLGGIRSSYKRRIMLDVVLNDLDHDPSTTVTDPSLELIRDKLKESLKTKVGKDDVEVDYTTAGGSVVTLPNAALTAATNLNMRVIISEAPSVPAADAAVWETKLIPAFRAVETYFKQHYALAAQGTQYGFTLRLPKVSNAVDSVDLDLVVHGIDYRTLRPETKGAFLSDLATAVRKGLDHSGVGYMHTIKDQIKVMVSSQKSTGAINVRTKIPAPDDTTNLLALNEKVDDEVQDGTLKTKIQDELVNMPGVKYISTWTPSAITVSMPGHINDFSGDTVGNGDAV